VVPSLQVSKLKLIFCIFDTFEDSGETSHAISVLRECTHVKLHLFQLILKVTLRVGPT
jgi:hypothetical protein